MQGMELVATVFGLAALCGVNIYLTVFVVGMCLHFQWLALPQALAPLEVLNDPVLIGLAALFYVLEFAADKVPWVDSLWDFLHTLIRPIGATMLALATLGDMSPYAQVLAALFAGTLALGTHLAKSGVRVMVNASPEPVSNSVVSLAEDGLVLGGVFLAISHPFILLALVVVAGIAIVYFAPFCWRQVRAFGIFLAHAIWPHRLLGRKVAAPSAALPEGPRQALARELGEDAIVMWALPVFLGGMRQWRANEGAWFVRTAEPARLVLLDEAGTRRVEARPVDDFELGLISYFLFEEVHLYFRAARRGWVIRVPRKWLAELSAVVRELEPKAVAPPAKGEPVPAPAS